MRLVSALLFVALTGSVTLADEAKPADPKPEVARQRVPLRVVRMLPETQQVLLLHKNKGTHVVAEVGQDIDGYIVDEIDEDEVTLVAPNGAEVILTAPDMSWRRRQAERKAASKKAATGAAVAVEGQAAEAMPQDPYAEGPADPYGDAAASPAAGDGAGNASATTTPVGEVRIVSANGAAKAGNAPTPAPVIPADPNAGITAFAEAVGADPSAAGSPAPAASAPAPTAKAVPKATSSSVDAAATLAAAATGAPAPAASPATPAAAGATFTVARSEVDAALADFGATAVTFDAKFVAEGLRIDAIAAGTLLEKAGLKKGDTITAVDGKPLRSFDDAADLYARMQTANRTTVVVQRAGKPLTLKVAIR